MNIIIEKAREEDKGRIFELLKLANMHYIPSKEMPGLTFENYFVARCEGKVVGFCGYKILSDTEAKTELMVVDPAFRGQGLGDRLQSLSYGNIIKKALTSLRPILICQRRESGIRRIFAIRRLAN